MKGAIILVSHLNLGKLFCVDASIMEKPHDEIKEIIFDHLNQHHRHLTEKMGFETYKEIFTTPMPDGELKLEMMGDEGILYITLEPMPLLHVVEPTGSDLIRRAMLAV